MIIRNGKNKYTIRIKMIKPLKKWISGRLFKLRKYILNI